MRVLVVGAGGHGTVVADILRAQKAGGDSTEFVGHLDDAAGTGRSTAGTLLGPIRDWRSIDHDAMIVAIGDNHTRKRAFVELTSRGAVFGTAIHPATTIAPDVVVGGGTMICAGAIVNPAALVGSNTIINTGASIDHHCRIGDHVHIAPGVRLGGNVTIGEGALVGIGAIVLPGKTVGPWAIVGAGAVVTEDVPTDTTVVGVPARTLRVTV